MLVPEAAVASELRGGLRVGLHRHWFLRIGLRRH
jgi:hypothetical protein